MQLSDLVQLARDVVNGHGSNPVTDAQQLAEGVLEALGVGFPDGWDKPHVSGHVDDDSCEDCDADGTTVHWAGLCLGRREEALGIGQKIIAVAVEMPDEPKP